MTYTIQPEGSAFRVTADGEPVGPRFRTQEAAQRFLDNQRWMAGQSAPEPEAGPDFLHQANPPVRKPGEDPTMTTVFTTCGWDGCQRTPEWDILAINSNERPGRVSSTCSEHLAPRLGEYYEAADLSQQGVWAWALPYDPEFVDDYEREGQYGETNDSGHPAPHLEDADG